MHGCWCSSKAVRRTERHAGEKWLQWCNKFQVHCFSTTQRLYSAINSYLLDKCIAISNILIICFFVIMCQKGKILSRALGIQIGCSAFADICFITLSPKHFRITLSNGQRIVARGRITRKGGFFTGKTYCDTGQSGAMQSAAAFTLTPLLIFAACTTKATHHASQWAG